MPYPWQQPASIEGSRGSREGSTPEDAGKAADLGLWTRPGADAGARKAEALAIWRGAFAIRGTPAETYLLSRGLDPAQLAPFDRPGEWPETLRFSLDHPGIALIAAVNDAITGLVVAVQRIFVTREGGPVWKTDAWKTDARPAAKSDPPEAPQGVKKRKVKLSLGPILGNAARFSCWPDPAGRWGLAEGCETALAAQQLHGFPVWAAIFAGNMAHIGPPHWAREAFVFSDHDSAGIAAAYASRRNLDSHPSLIRTHVVRAALSDTDIADVLIAP